MMVQFAAAVVEVAAQLEDAYKDDARCQEALGQGCNQSRYFPTNRPTHFRANSENEIDMRLILLDSESASYCICRNHKRIRERVIRRIHELSEIFSVLSGSAKSVIS